MRNSLELGEYKLVLIKKIKNYMWGTRYVYLEPEPVLTYTNFFHPTLQEKGSGSIMLLDDPYSCLITRTKMTHSCYF